jgi:membrane protease YdiL (CAAX protease family)
MKIAALVTAVVAASMAFAFRLSLAGTPTMWFGVGIPYAALSALALYRLYDDGTLLDVFKIRAGDVTLGVLTAGLAYGGAWAFEHFFISTSAPRLAWLFRMAAQIGSGRPSPVLLGLIIVGLAVAEELVWRGMVLGALAESFGTRRAAPLAALAYALAHVPSMFTLADSDVGLNPLLVIAAFGCGLVWSFTATLTGRLPPVIVSHAVFSYFAIAMLLPKLG